MTLSCSRKETLGRWGFSKFLRHGPQRLATILAAVPIPCYWQSLSLESHKQKSVIADDYLLVVRWTTCIASFDVHPICCRDISVWVPPFTLSVVSEDCHCFSSPSMSGIEPCFRSSCLRTSPHLQQEGYGFMVYSDYRACNQ